MFLRIRGVAARMLLTALLAMLAASDAVAQDKVPADKRLPQGVMAYVSVPNVTLLREKFWQTSIGQMIQDESMTQFKAQFAELLAEWSGKIQEELGISLEELENLVEGEVALSVVRPPGKGIGIIGLVDFSTKQELFTQLLTKFEEELKNHSAQRTTSTYAETEIVSYSVPSPQEGGAPMKFAFLVKDGMFAAASSRTFLELVLDRWNGEHEKSFAKDTNYAYVMDNCRSDSSGQPVFAWYLTPVEGTLAAMSLSPDMAMPSAMITGMLPTLGLNKLKAYGGAAELAVEGFDQITRSVICVEPPPAGVLNVFQFPATIEGPPEWIPASAHYYLGLHWDLQSGYEAVGKLTDSYMGPGSFEKLVKQAAEKDPMLHPKEDIIDQLTGVVHVYVQSAGETPEDVVWAAAVGVTDEAAVEEVLEKLLEEISDEPYRTEEVDGVTVYLPPNEDGQGAVAIHEGQLYIAASLEVLEPILTSETMESLEDSPLYGKVSEQMPEKSSMLGFTDTAATMKLGYESLRSGSLDMLTEGKVDFSLLPEYEAISKYFLPSAYYLTPIERGAISVQFTPAFEE